jgi:hypothetical protein
MHQVPETADDVQRALAREARQVVEVMVVGYALLLDLWLQLPNVRPPTDRAREQWGTELGKFLRDQGAAFPPPPVWPSD